MSLKLPLAPNAYDPGDQARMRGAIERADLKTVKTDAAVDRLLMAKADGAVGKVTITADGYVAWEGHFPAVVTPGGADGQVQFNSAGAFGGFTLGGDAALVTSTGMLTIANAAVTYAKMQNTSAASVLLGRGAGSGAGALQELTLGTGLSLSGTVLSAAGTGTVTTTGTPTSGNLTKFSGASSITNGDLSGDVTTSGTLATTIAANAVTNAKLRQSGALSIVGRSANSTGNIADISATAASNSILREKSSALQFDSISNLLDDVFGSSQGNLLYRGASGWSTLAPGTAGTFLQTLGASANPQWANPAGGSGGGLYTPVLSILPTGANTHLSDHSAGTVTLNNTTMGLYPAVSGNTANWITALPSTPYSITALILPGVSNVLGLGWTDGTKFQFCYLNTNGNFNVQNNSAFNTFAGTVINTFAYAYGCPFWLKIRDDGTTVYYMIGSDGLNFTTMYSVAKSSGYLGATGYSHIAIVGGNCTIASWNQGT